MNEMGLSASITRSAARQIARHTRGHAHGPITRLMSPSDFGQFLKPFVFLDLFDDDGVPFSGFGLHPHSGIATLTYIAEFKAEERLFPQLTEAMAFIKRL